MGQSEQSDKELQELLELAKSKPTVDESERIDEIEEFILANGIRPSTKEWIESQPIYWYYRKWCIANNIKFKGRLPFNKMFRKRFNTKMSNTGFTAYGIEDSMRFKLSQDEWFKMRKQFRDERTKNAKKRRKVPGTKPKL